MDVSTNRSEDLVARYLQAIGQYLPAASRTDILAELRSELLEQLDARAEEWGRPLDEADVAALLRAHGKPETVALRYLPQRSLIGPTVFPFYLFTLKRVLPLVVIVYAIGNAATLLLSPPHGDLAGHIVRAIFGLIPALFLCWGVVTIVFAAIEYARSKPSVRASLEQWDPYKLPAVAPQTGKQKSFNVRVFELAVHILWMLYVLAIPAHPFLILGPGAWALKSMGIGLAPIWSSWYAIILGMLSIQLVIRILALRPGDQPWAKPLNLAVNFIGLIAVALLAFSRQVIVSTNGVVDPQKLADANHGISLALRIVLILGIFGLCSEAWKYLRDLGRVQHRLAV
jgi:uncharacterized membrane protein YedE/YeeE